MKKQNLCLNEGVFHLNVSSEILLLPLTKLPRNVLTSPFIISCAAPPSYAKLSTYEMLSGTAT